jgi:zinc protease
MSLKMIQTTLVLSLAMLMMSLSAEAGVKIQQWQTATGAEVYFVENHDLPIVDLSVNFSAGSVRDSSEKSGLAGITRYLMALGAAGMSDEMITNKMADIGAILSGEFNSDRATFKLRTLSSAREQSQALEVFVKVLQKPDFPQAVLDREKARIIAGLQESATQPESISNKAFMAALYGKHPYSLDESGEVETISKITREDLQAL